MSTSDKKKVNGAKAQKLIREVYEDLHSPEEVINFFNETASKLKRLAEMRVAKIRGEFLS